jgi:hypothetical protein
MKNIIIIILGGFVILYRLMTFKINSKYEKWFEITSGILVWVNVLIILGCIRSYRSIIE